MTIWVIGIVTAAVLVAAGLWLLLRGTKGTPPPGRHRQPPRDPHDPIREDDEEPPEQP